MINLNDTTPAAEIGYINGKFQVDVSGNVSVEFPFGGTIKLEVSPSSSPAGAVTLDASLANSFRIDVDQEITSMTIDNATDGEEITLLFVQDSTGHAITLATNMAGATAPSTGANTVSCQKFSYDLTNDTWYAIAAGVTGM